MTGTHYAIMAYMAALVLLWGYALGIWLGHRAQARRSAKRDVN